MHTVNSTNAGRIPQNTPTETANFQIQLCPVSEKYNVVHLAVFVIAYMYLTLLQGILC